jgi:septal ring factor EnvC (AmiA/AmiB activator)
MRRVSATLESLAAWGDTDGLPKAGRLTADLDPPGFDVLSMSMGGKKLAAANVLAFRAPRPAEDPAATRARLREAVQAAEKALRDTRRDAERAESALAKAGARVEAVEKQKREIEARYAEAKDDAHQASTEAKKAAQAVADAERSLAKAKGALAG